MLETRTHLEELPRREADATFFCVEVKQPVENEEAFRTVLVNVERSSRVTHDPEAKACAANRRENLAEPGTGRVQRACVEGG